MKQIDAQVNLDKEAQHWDLLDKLHETYVAKNADYGDSFSIMFQEFGLTSVVIRLYDKLLRLKTLTTQEAKVKDESIRDTLLDLANYSIMAVMELDKEADV